MSKATATGEWSDSLLQRLWTVSKIVYLVRKIDSAYSHTHSRSEVKQRIGDVQEALLLTMKLLSIAYLVCLATEDEEQ